MAANSRHDQFINLRRRMTDMGYTESFGIDAVDVVEHLLADVLNANQAYRQAQGKESRLINDLSLAQAQLFPLRKENARL
eukprot:gene31720-40827_t